MPVYFFLLLTLALAGWSLWLAARAPNGAARLFAGSLALFICLYGGWVFLSIYLRYIFAVIFILILLLRCFRKRNRPAKRQVLLYMLGAMAFGLLSLLYFTGYPLAWQRPTISLQLPFKQGRYLVFQGGRGLPANAFHVAARGAVYAIDLVKLNRFGNRAKAIFSKNLADYETFGDTVYAPVAASSGEQKAAIRIICRLSACAVHVT